MPPRAYMRLRKAQEGAATGNPYTFVNESQVADPNGNLQNVQLNPSSNPIAEANGLGIDANTIYAIMQAAAAGNQGQNASSWQSQVVLPPAIEALLAENQQTKTLADILAANIPAGQEFYGGFEPGGIADVLMGIITGKGVDQSRIPDSARRVQRSNIPSPDDQRAMEIGQRILDAMRTVGTGGSVSTPAGAVAAPAAPTTPATRPSASILGF